MSLLQGLSASALASVKGHLYMNTKKADLKEEGRTVVTQVREEGDRKAG
jgi:hypothetical protein